MTRSPKKQQGMTLISMACIAIILVSMFLLVLNIIPIYMDHGKVTSALNSIKGNLEARNDSPEQLSTRLFKLLQVNNADDIIKKEDVTINKLDNGATQIEVRYEVVKKIVGNASILVQFDDTLEIK